MTGYFDRQGQPMDMADWTRSFQAGNAVAKTTVGDVDVATVWLGLNHRFGDGPPLIFETMVFGGNLDQECERYSTEAAALAGHDQMVARVRDAQDPS